MGGASPYRARFIGGTPGRDDEDVPCEGGEKYFGLVNVKNTCYVNSVLQALYFCTSFRRSAIHHLSDDRDDDPGGESLLTSLAELFAQIEGQKKNVGCLTPRRFLTRLRKANDLFCNSEHQDAHEFLQFLLNDIVENAKKRVKRQRERERQEALMNGQAAHTNGTGSTLEGGTSVAGLMGVAEEQAEEEPRTWVHDILQGYLVNQMKCLCCENVTVRRETFFDLSVDIEQHTSIAACLRAFESTERLRASNKFFCDTCGCLQEAEKRLRIYQLPSVLTLHLKRFKYVERLGRCCRLPYRVVFPLQLRVVEHRPPRRHAPGGGAHADAAAAAAAVNQQTQQHGCVGVGGAAGVGSGAQQDGAGGGVDGEDNATASQPPSRLFELRSVVVHIGRDSSYGHYVTVVRNGDRCVLLDDDVVRVVEPEILRSFYGTAGTSQFHGHGASGHDRHQHGGGWGSNDPTADGGGHGGGHSGGGERYPGPTPAAPYYERAPEGTCCGYLLIYEAVDRTTDHDAGASGVDLGSATDWISEDRNFSDSDSGESTEERPGSMPSRHHPNACDDGELTQAFEQRCIPGGPGSRQLGGGVTATTAATTHPASAPVGGSAAGGAAATAAAVNSDGRGRERTAGGLGGAFAWAAADNEGGRTPQTTGHGGHSVRTLGSVVPAAGSAADTVSLSRVNVVTVPSPTGSLEGVMSSGGDTDRGG
mmetsp:Transcript_30142/g.76177  ORF Transcript_30142/g.76177 Transcript_30142/m.76177 type:complete len:704 (+) Transcript_30142:104-2215(+)